MPDPLVQIERQIRAIVTEGLRADSPLDQTLSKVRELLRRSGLGTKLQEALLADARTQFTWIDERRLSPADRAAVQQIFSDSAQEYARIGKAIDDKVVKALTRSLQMNLDSRQMEQLVGRAVKGTAGSAASITHTALGAFDRVDTFRQAAEAEVDRFRYAGPPAQRAFCVGMLQQAAAGRTYTREQINELSNGQGLSVLYYCGGWRCHHTWEAVV
jgi:hypothetical protein